MPWKETCVVDERMKFVVDWERLVLREAVSMTELCRRYGVSRKTGYGLVARYEAEGVAGLGERSRAPHRHPNATPLPLETAIIAVRGDHPTWGAKKIRAFLERREPRKAWPALSTTSEILDRHGLVRRRKRHVRVPPGPSPLDPCVAANDVWGVDFKGWFRTKDGARCDPLSLSDLTTRYVLRLQVMRCTDGAHVWPLIEAAFREYGLPLKMRSDNGPPFAAKGAGGLSRFAVQLIKAGVTPERITPGKPQQNGRHERMHLTLKSETASPPAESLRAQQRCFDTFRHAFNEERPHEALGQRPPAELYRPSPRPFSGRLREPGYPCGHEVRRVRHNGEIKWQGQTVFIGEALAGEPVGLEPQDEGSWRVSFGPIELGTLDHKANFTAHRTGARARSVRQTQPPG